MTDDTNLPNKTPEGKPAASIASDLSDLPEWIPAAVKEVAVLLPFRSKAVGEGETSAPVVHLAPVVHRLLVDPRMEKVWAHLRRKDTIPKLDQLQRLERLETWTIPGTHSIQQQGCAALFIATVLEFSTPQVIGTRADAQASADRYLHAAEVLREFLSESPDPFWSRDAARLRDAANVLIPTLEALAEAWRQSGNVRILARSSAPHDDNNEVPAADQVRAHARALALATHRIFGEYMYRTVATVMSVAADTTVTERAVRNWCIGLP